MIVKLRLAQSEGLPVQVVFNDEKMRLVQSSESPDMIEDALQLLVGRTHVYLIGSVVNRAFEPHACVSGQSW